MSNIAVGRSVYIAALFSVIAMAPVAPAIGQQEPPPKGTISTEEKTEEQLSMESMALSYKALTGIAEEISWQIACEGGNIQNLVIYNQGDFDSLLQYQTFMLQTKALLTGYQSLFPSLAASELAGPQEPGKRGALAESSGPIATSLSSIVSGVNWGSLLFGAGVNIYRTDTVLKRGNVKISEVSFVALLANELKKRKPGMKVLYEHVSLSWAQQTVLEDQALAKLAEAAASPGRDKNFANRPLADFLSQPPRETDSVVNRLTRLNAYNALATLEIGENKGREERIKILKTLNGQADGLASIMKADEKGVSPLSMIVKAENLSHLVDTPNTGVLYLELLRAGGTDRTTTSLLRGSKLRYSGGAVAQYILFDAKGAIILSDTVYRHTGFSKLEQPEGKDSFQTMQAIRNCGPAGTEASREP